MFRNMWLYALLCVGTTLVGAQPLNNQADTCWPELTHPFDRLFVKMAELPPTSPAHQSYLVMVQLADQQLNYDLSTEEGRHDLVCALQEVDSVADLVQALNIRAEEDIQSFQHGYNMLKMFYPMIGGKQTLLTLYSGLDNFLAWMSRTGFPSIPFDGATEDEMYNAFIEVFNSVLPILEVVAEGPGIYGLSTDSILIMARHLAHAFAVSKTMDEFENNAMMPNAAAYLRQAMAIHQSIPMLREMLAFDRVLIEEFDKHGMFTLPPQ